MNGTSGFQEVRSSTSRSSTNRLLDEQRHQFGNGSWHFLRMSGSQNCIEVHPLLKEIVKFFVSFFIFGFIVSLSVQALAVCPNYQVVSPLEEQKQEEVDWCTFAATRVVTSHYGLTKSQCQLVGDVVGQDCCTNTGNPACHPDPPLWPHDVFNSSTVHFSYTPYIVSASALPWSKILDEICGHNRPLLAVATTTMLYEAHTPNWHAVVVEGYRLEATGEQKVRVFDPQEDLCDSSTCSDQNPRFLNYDYFFLSEVTHHTDYVDIAPTSDVTPPAAPKGLKIL